MEASELERMATKALAEDGDYLRQPDREMLIWLAAQLACYPKRVHEERTTSDGFLRRSAAAFILAALRSPADVDLREALTPSAETKAAYSGEFSFVAGIGFDDDGYDISARFTVPWDTIKEIMAAIRSRAALSSGESQ